MGEDADCDKVNDNMDIKIYTSSDRLIGEVICADSDDCDMLILFNDGTTQSVCYYLDQIEKAIEDTFDQYDK